MATLYGQFNRSLTSVHTSQDLDTFLTSRLQIETNLQQKLADQGQQMIQLASQVDQLTKVIGDLQKNQAEHLATIERLTQERNALSFRVTVLDREKGDLEARIRKVEGERDRARIAEEKAKSALADAEKPLPEQPSFGSMLWVATNRFLQPLDKFL